jgi:hypothetical protein
MCVFSCSSTFTYAVLVLPVTALQMHFPADYSSTDSPFEGLSALQYYVFLLTSLPELAFTSDAYPGLKPGGAQVSNVTVALPDKEPVDGATFLAASAGPGSNSSEPTPALQVLDIDTSTLTVPTTAAPDEQPAVDMSQVVDTEAPRLTLLGDVMVQLMQTEPYEDAGATVGDNIDGNTVTIRRTIQLCTREEWMETATAATNTSLVCSNTILAAVQTSLPLVTASGVEQVYVITYTARDAAGNQAAPVRRYIGVVAR